MRFVGEEDNFATLDEERDPPVERKKEEKRRGLKETGPAEVY